MPIRLGKRYDEVMKALGLKRPSTDLELLDDFQPVVVVDDGSAAVEPIIGPQWGQRITVAAGAVGTFAEIFIRSPVGFWPSFIDIFGGASIWVGVFAEAQIPALSVLTPDNNRLSQTAPRSASVHISNVNNVSPATHNLSFLYSSTPEVLPLYIPPDRVLYFAQSNAATQLDLTLLVQEVPA